MDCNTNTNIKICPLLPLKVQMRKNATKKLINEQRSDMLFGSRKGEGNVKVIPKDCFASIQ